jgi:two-component system, OmpR family, sensor histidine kinase KdpD
MPLVRLDFGLMSQVISNILHNMSEYTPEGSPVDITVSTGQNECVLALGDRGPGLPGDTLKNIFTKFYRIPGSKAGGIGLGLSIAKGFVEAHHGTLSAENRPDGGTLFTVRLPLDTQQKTPEST